MQINKTKITRYDLIHILEEARSVVASNQIDQIKSSSSDLLTETDLAVETFLIERLQTILPEAGFVTEETEDHQTKEYNWIVDPIDGTTNFVHGLPAVAISVALWQGNEPLIGAVAHLDQPLVYSAETGKGAFIDHAPFNDSIPLKVSDETKLENCLFATGFAYDKTTADQSFEIAKRLYLAGRDIRREGSAALDVVNVAAGKLQAYAEINVRFWDMAAATVILNEAGGQITNLAGKEIVWSEKPEAVLVACPGVQAQLIDLFSDI